MLYQLREKDSFTDDLIGIFTQESEAIKTSQYLNNIQNNTRAKYYYYFVEVFTPFSSCQEYINKNKWIVNDSYIDLKKIME